MEIVPAGNNCNRVFGDDGPSFFKIIHGRAMEELRIPPHFMKHLVNEVADRATLESPSGDLCTVLLHQKENGTYLQDGWPDFVRNHSLGNNEFLIFRYDGSLHFSVRIYDVSGLERVGASVTCKHQEAGSSIEKRKRGRPRKNKIDSLPLQQLEVSKPCEPEAASSTGRRKPGRPRKKVDPINFHQSDVSAELCKPEAASSTGRRKGGRPRKKVDPINLHLTENAPEARKHKVDPINPPQSESCKHAPEAASKEERKRGRPRKKEVTDTLILHQSESCKHAAAAASSGKRKPGRPRKRDDLLHHSKSPKYAEAHLQVLLSVALSSIQNGHCPVEFKRERLDSDCNFCRREALIF